MMKHLLIILIFSASIFIKTTTTSTIEKLTLFIWPNEKCEIIKSKYFPNKCQNGKHLSWLVRMNSSVENYNNLGQENSQQDEMKCREDCQNSIDCLTIQQNEISCKKFAFINKFHDLINNDVLQLACCDKQTPEIMSDFVITKKGAAMIQNAKCKPSPHRNDCMYFPVWNEEPSHFDGRDIDILPIDSQECEKKCYQEPSCVLFYNEGKNCKLKYSQGYSSQKTIGSKYSASAVYCCEEPLYFHAVDDTDISIRIDRKNTKDDKFKCPSGWKKQWIQDETNLCKTNETQPIETLKSCYSQTTLSLCWNKGCSFVVMNSGQTECSLYKEFHYCISDPLLTTDLKIFYIGCVKNIANDMRFPEVRSVFTTSCIFDRPDIIGYNGTITKSSSNMSCINWSLTKFYSDHFINNNNQHNYCRNINNDPRGAWCITSGHLHMEYCSVPKCENAPIENANYTLLRNCKITKPIKQCNTKGKQWVMLRQNGQNNCPIGILATEKVSMEDYCFYACVFHPACLFAFYNVSDNVCLLAENVTVCQNQNNQVKFSVAGINCCLRERSDLHCPKLSVWFKVLSTISYLVLIFVLTVSMYIQIKHGNIKNQFLFAIDEYKKEFELLMRISSRKFSESKIYPRTESGKTAVDMLSESMSHSRSSEEESL